MDGNETNSYKPRKGIKPVWVRKEAKVRLDSYCKRTSQTQIDVLTRLIMTHINDPEDSFGGGVWVF